MRGYENQLSVAKGWRADYIITYGNYWGARLSYRTTAGGRYLFLCKHNDVFQHGGKLVTMATRVILGRTDSVRGQWGQSGRAHSRPGKIREQKRKAGWECETGRGWRTTRDKDYQMFEVRWEVCASMNELKWEVRRGKGSGQFLFFFFFFIYIHFLESMNMTGKECEWVRERQRNKWGNRG